MRGQAMGFLEQEPVRTPYLDQFASQSLVFTEAVSNYPICSPTRASLMTGQYPQGHGVWGNCNTITAPFGYELEETAQTWSDILKKQGYSMGYIGKWHLDSPHEPYINTSNGGMDLIICMPMVLMISITNPCIRPQVRTEIPLIISINGVLNMKQTLLSNT